MTLSLIGLCSAFFVWIVQLDLGLAKNFGDEAFESSWTYRWAVVPSQGLQVWQLLTYQFVHASWAHLISNMWYLLIFGWILENAWGPLRYLVFVLLAGALAVIPEIFVQGQQSAPIVGASGSGAFLLGACVALFPLSKIKMLFLVIPVPQLPTTFFIPLRYLVYFWLLIQVSGLATHFWVEPKSVAYTTHLAGFGLGLLIGFLFYLRRSETYEDIDLSGRDLDHFYSALKSLQKNQQSEAEALLIELSEKHSQSFGLQSQLYSLALRKSLRSLAHALLDSTPEGDSHFRPFKKLKRDLESYRSHFGEFAQLSPQRLEDLKASLSEPEFEALSSLISKAGLSDWSVRSLSQNRIE